jgi:hypothetical protein
MKQISIDYCALKYLNNYLEFEKDILNEYQLNNKKWSRENFKKFATYFKVARNLKELSDANPRYVIVCDIINNFTITENNIENVQNLVKKVKLNHKKELVSLCSKALWFKNTNCKIYDSQAKKGLEKTSGNKIKNYNEYYNCWVKNYTLNRGKIVNSVNKLANMKNYTLNGSFECVIIKNEWFNERVFDTYLREIGKIKNKLCIQKLKN